MVDQRSRRASRSQISLRILILTMLIAGAVAGMWGPALTRAMRDWSTPRPAPTLPSPIASPRHPTAAAETGYYESAETPLR